MSNLSFSKLREANMARIPRFKNAKGEAAHSEVDGSDWTPADWLQAVVGELGELANMLKKIKRGDYSLEEGRVELAKEFADVAIYLDIFAYQFRIDLGDAVMNKFNEVSDRVGAGVYFDEDCEVFVDDTK
jgi:NTP pyrophosphatase (non-canonical NTP hydrolase)